MSRELESAQQTAALAQDAETLSRLCAVDTYLNTFASPPKSATELRDYRIVLLTIDRQRPTHGRKGTQSRLVLRIPTRSPHPDSFSASRTRLETQISPKILSVGENNRSRWQSQPKKVRGGTVNCRSARNISVCHYPSSSCSTNVFVFHPLPNPNS
ncbi:uncharacterized protein FMAN_11702 [Fusarium mangiferae]|uniref:Uncharacterized protein n=1 Tax=Fusarium mangiferae TaxID=192010 RepID=A0A1L7TG72_FUSMA|nr:uncharacterized protein FMAN_11702 [Fusarium mangiferae]CVK97708.1 uncharacterized protein FMAN_11702 [Fusarium mangiferae]